MPQDAGEAMERASGEGGFRRDLLVIRPDTRRGRMRRMLVWLGLGVVAALLIWRLSNVVMIILLAALLAIVLRGAADWLAARIHLPPRLVLAALVIVSILLGAGLAYWIGPRVIAQGQELVVRIAGQVDRFRAHLAETDWGKPFAAQLSPGGGSTVPILGPAETALMVTFRTGADLIVLVVTALYFAVAPEIYVRGMVRLVPIPHRPRARNVLADVARALRRWVLGQLVDMLTVGVLAAIGLRLAGVPEPYALAILSGLLTFIPYFGALIAAIPALIVALTVSWMTGVWAVLVFLVCHAAEGYIVAPLVQRRLVDLPPAASIVAMTVMGTLFGPIGIILGTPLAAAGLGLLRELYFAELLGDRETAE